MVIGIVENLRSSYDFTNKAFRSFGDWLILIILFIIPIIGWILLLGFVVRVYRGGEAKLGEWIKMFIDGILLLIISFIYMIVPLIVFALVGGTAFITSVVSYANIMNPSSVIGAGLGLGIGLILAIIIAIIFGFLGTMAVVRFAKTEKFGAAFEVGELFKIIGKIGWLHYILSRIVLAIVFAIIFFVIGLIMGFIPFLGMLIMWIIGPIMLIWEAKFYAQLYESA